MMAQLLRAWMLLTAAIVVAFFIWAYIPVVIPFIALTIGLGAVTVGIVKGARWLERWLAAGRAP